MIDRRTADIAVVAAVSIIQAIIAVVSLIACRDYIPEWLLKIITPIEFFAVVGGGIVLFAAARKVPAAGYRKLGILAWATIAIVSPLFAVMFLLPWGVLIITSPIVLWILAGWRK